MISILRKCPLLNIAVCLLSHLMMIHLWLMLLLLEAHCRPLLIYLFWM
jgi:hypothetical protein